jgi:hypothetical protein
MLDTRISRIISIASVLVLAIGSGGCASDNFEDAGPESTNYQSFFSKYMVAAITREMELRGYTLSDDPDLLVNFNAILREKTDVRTTPAPMYGGYYGYRGGFYDPWMGYGYAQETHVSQYTEGTFNIDLVDARKKKLVWEAVGTGRISQKLLDELEERVNIGVAKYFEKYPFTAGSNVPVTTEK